MTRCTRRSCTAAYRPRNRTSQSGRAIGSGSNSPLSSTSNAAMGSRTEVSQNALCALQQALVLSA